MKITFGKVAISVVCLMVPLLAHSKVANGDNAPLVVHEWGTFTVLQNEKGEPLPGVNVNEERLPGFVHRLMPGLIQDFDQLTPVSGPRSKGIVASHPYAIMRMETPVIYFYPPASQSQPLKLDVSVSFRGGWISEWYPRAEVDAPGFRNNRSDIGVIDPKKTGVIRWRDIEVGGRGKPPETSDHVWLAPREVDSALVSTSNGETERYLFYRGVANLRSPLRVVRDERRDVFKIQANRAASASDAAQQFAAVWLVDIRADGKTAFKRLSALTARSGEEQQTLATVPATFEQRHYGRDNLLLLRDQMRAALIEEGLFPREADAMLNTWKLSYFKSPGLRLFFTLPRNWTDSVLPLTLSVPAKVQRAMIGRIEIVTPAQRQLLGKIGAATPSSAEWLYNKIKQLPESEQREAWRALAAEEKSFADLGVQVPAEYQAYLDLGRFRDALVRDELRRHPTETLDKFVRNYYLYHFGRPPAEFERDRSVKPASTGNARPELEE